MFNNKKPIDLGVLIISNEQDIQRSAEFLQALAKGNNFTKPANLVKPQNTYQERKYL